MKSKNKRLIFHLLALTAALALAVTSAVIHKSDFFPETGNNAENLPGLRYYDAADGFNTDETENAFLEKTFLSEGEKLIAALELGGTNDEQVIAFKNKDDNAGQIYIAHIRFDENERSYIRAATLPSAASSDNTVSLFTKDLIGDRSACVLLSGLNSSGEHTLTVFRKSDAKAPFEKINEFIIDGTISIDETERGVNYERGIVFGKSWTISTRGRDMSSNNNMDQIETTYTYNAAQRAYVKEKSLFLPGAVIDSQRQNEILSGNKNNFENFIAGLWFYVDKNGKGINSRQYVYIDPANREIIFYADDTQEVFTWTNASSTRYGLYIATSNISVTTLRRFVDIELESLDSIRLKIFEDVRLKITVDAQWDGSYRKAPSLKNAEESARNGAQNAVVDAHINEIFESSFGKVYFYLNGEYKIVHGEDIKTGKYAFFTMGTDTVLELRPAPASNIRKMPREVYTVARDGAGLVLSRARIGTKEIEKYNEASIALYVSTELSAGSNNQR